jgi:cytochrome o ubiquinol oxidase subunit 2
LRGAIARTIPRRAYEPDWDHSTKLELVIWGAPLLIVIVLGLVTWIYTHKLDPYRPLDRLDAHRPIPASSKPLIVQAVAMDWKWLFIYPEQGIATVNELVVPVDVPIRFKVSATSVMNAFYVPALAGMIYAMPGMETQAERGQNKPVQSFGISSNYSGAGYSDMKFGYRGVPQGDFDGWVQEGQDRRRQALDRANTWCWKSRASRIRCSRFRGRQRSLLSHPEPLRRRRRSAWTR